MGTATYTFHAKTVCKDPEGNKRLEKHHSRSKDEAKLRTLAGKIRHKDRQKYKGNSHLPCLMLWWLEFMLIQMKKSSNVLAFAPKQRIEVWRKLGILPGGPLNEVMDAVFKHNDKYPTVTISPLQKRRCALGSPAIYGSQDTSWDGTGYSVLETAQPHAVQRWPWDHRSIVC